MDVGVAVNQVRVYQDSARNLQDRAIILLQASESIFKSAKRLCASAKNLKSIHKPLLRELERSGLPQASGNVIDHTVFSALKNLELALGYQKQAENKLSQIQSLQQQALLVKESAELLDYSFTTIVKTLKILHQRK